MGIAATSRQQKNRPSHESPSHSPRIPEALQTLYLASNGTELIEVSEEYVTTTPRVPEALQALFLASNGGTEPIEVSEEDVATKSYHKKIIFMGKRTKLKILFSKFIEGHKRFKTSDRKWFERMYMSRVSEVPKNTLYKVGTVDKDSKEQTEQAQPLKYGPSPQQYLDNLLYSRGYPTEIRKSMVTGYFNKPTALQQASYNTYLINLVRERKLKKLKKIVESGISPNPCNMHGESLLHMICRHSEPDVLKLFLDAGASVQVADDSGRTLLHDACWRPEPSFEIIEMIARKDLTLFYLGDIRGAPPLEYIHKHDWHKWIAFIESKKDLLWPVTDPWSTQTETFADHDKLELLKEAPLTCPLPNPENSLTVEVAAMVTCGRLSPEDAVVLCMEDEDEIIEERGFDQNKETQRITEGQEKQKPSDDDQKRDQKSEEKEEDSHSDEKEDDDEYSDNNSDSDNISDSEDCSDDSDDDDISDSEDCSDDSDDDDCFDSGSFGLSSEDDYSDLEQDLAEIMGNYLRKSTLAEF